MNKAFYIVGIVFSFIFICVVSYYIDAVESARIMESFSSYSSYSDPYSTYSSSSIYNLYVGVAEEYTSEIAIASIFFFLIFLTSDLLGLLKIKTKTVRVFSIIGLSFSGILFLWNFAVMANPSSVSFDEVGPFYSLYAMFMLASSIVGLVQAVRYGRKKNVSVRENADLLDS